MSFPSDWEKGTVPRENLPAGWVAEPIEAEVIKEGWVQLFTASQLTPFDGVRLQFWSDGRVTWKDSDNA